MTSLKKKPLTEKQKQQVIFDRMAMAIAKYIQSMDGLALVVGGISIGYDPDDLKGNYFIQIDITGKRPTKKFL